MSAPVFRYGERPPGPAAAPWVLSYWTFQADVDPAPDDPYIVWPDGCANVALVRHPNGMRMLVSTGPRVTALQPPVQAGNHLWGVRLWPDAIDAVLGVRPRTLRDQMGLAPAAIAGRFATLDAALPASDDPDVVLPALDRWMTARLSGTMRPDVRIRAALSTIVAARGEIPLAEVAQRAGMGLRQLQRLFPEATGLTLREWARVRRLREALALRLAHRPGNWSRIAAATGFVDHAHLTHEFVALTGLAPSAAQRLLEMTGHDNVVP